MSKSTPVRVLTKYGKPGFLAPDGRVLPLVSGASDPGPVVEGEQGQPVPPVEQAPAPEPQGIVIPNEKPTPAEQQQADLLFTREDIERARREEKDKLYGRLQTMEEELASVREEREARAAAEAEAQRQAEEAERRAAEEEMSARELIEAKDREWQERLARIEAEREEERRVFEMERQFQALEQYRLQAIAQNEDSIMPELRDLITGNTQEEIDNSIALAVDKTTRILQQVQAQQQTLRQGQRAASVTAPAGAPTENDTTYQTLTPEDIRDMDMNEYRQHRDKLLGAVSQRARAQGPYG